jgi:hypothetical protein
MNKLKAILVGGDPSRNESSFQKIAELVDIHHVGQNRQSIPGSLGRDAECIIVLYRWAPATLVDQAKNLAKARKIPLVLVKSANYVISELETHGLFKKNGSAVVEPPKRGAVRAAPDPDPQPEVPLEPKTLGLAPDKVWERYGNALQEAAQLLLMDKPSYPREEFIVSLAKNAGIPEPDCGEMITELALRGLLVDDGEIVGSTENVVLPEQEIPKPVSKEDAILERIVLLGGLPEGPYKNIGAIRTEAAKYRELEYFASITPSSWYRNYMKAAEIKVVEKRGGKLYIVHDPAVKLTRIAQPEPVAPFVINVNADLTGPPEPLKETPGPVSEYAPPPPRETPAEVPRGPEAPSELAVRSSGMIRLPADQDQLMLWAKKFIPEQYWSDMAAMAIARRLKAASHATYVSLREKFSPEEWDALAWETLGEFPVKQFSAFFKGDWSDITCVCGNCNEQFVFTTAEQQRQWRTKGFASTPRLCQTCWRRRREVTGG